MASPGVPISHAPEVSAEQVADYLRRNPDFLAGHAELLDRLTPPSRATGDGVVDLQRFMIYRLRGRHADLLPSGRRNLSQQSQINDAVSALIGAEVVTVTPKILRQLVNPPLTDKGLAAFLADWAKTGQTIAGK